MPRPFSCIASLRACAFRSCTRFLVPLSLACLVVSGCGAPLAPVAPPRPWGQFAAPAPTAGVGYAEPPAAAAFVDAFVRSDEVTVEHVASPLYRAEWALRGVSVEDRELLYPHRDDVTMPAAPWAHFTYLNGFVDGDGFGHLLYGAEATAPGASHTSTVWRIDTDRLGRVIWNELVWLCSDQATALVPVTASTSTPGVALPSLLTGAGSRLLIGARSTTTSDGYYAVPLGMTADGGQTLGAGKTTMFFAVDSEGQTRFGVWSYGQLIRGRGTASRRELLAQLGFEADESALLAAYLATLS